MKPIRATFNYKEEVDVDVENPAHAKYIGMPVAIENRSIDGFVTDVLPLEDSFKDRILDGVNDKGISIYKDAAMQKTGVYVVFWMDMGDHYQMSIQDFNSITVSKQEMKNYVNRFYSA